MANDMISRKTVEDMLNALGGYDAAEEWAKGWDEAIDTALKNLDKIPSADDKPAKGATIPQLINEAHKTATEHGWWDNEPDFGTCIALCHAELSEALEEYRDGRKYDDAYIGDHRKPCGIPVELADVCIRIFDLCGRYDIDLETAIVDKMAYNETRPYRHGGKVI